MRYLDGEFLAPQTLDRAGLVRVQTPQGFSRDLLLLAYQRAREQGRELPDDAAALLALGEQVATVPGEPANLKLTYPEDRELLRALAKNLYRH
jgi:2-C-methyl-D-erythritol 4-phosphate cytidylyltransferase/2-C-methyl-D-erythritol 2,4-cyclodiphosphate synthase